jgi:serine/threonine protein phosphatase PrpC
LSKQLRLDVAQLTDVGRKRPHNEDNMAYVIPKDEQALARKGALFIVADGMGGHAAGEVASEIAVETVTKAYYEDDGDDIPVSLINAIKRANTIIHQCAGENSLRSGMGTTCVAAVLCGNSAYIANVGDSRVYLIRQPQVRQITEDHSWVEEQVRAGLLTHEQARSHTQRNVITRCLGTQTEVEVDIFLELLSEDDTFVLCTDGLSGSVTEEDIRSIVTKFVPQESVYHLVERANDNGGPDNITAIVIHVAEIGAEMPCYLVPAGHEADTVILGRIPTALLDSSPRSTNGGRWGTQLGRASEPLVSVSNVTLPTADTPSVRPDRRRLLYPTIAMFLLFAIVLFGGGGYYAFYSLNGVSYQLSNAQTLINRANAEAAQDPIDAIQQLAQAQKALLTAQGSLLVGDQSSLFQTLEKQLRQTLQKATMAYNQQQLITQLPCQITQQKQLARNVQPVSLGILKDKTTSYTYILGTDRKLYLLDATNLVSPYSFFDKMQAFALASSDQHLFALTQSVTGSTNYNLAMLSLDQAPRLKEDSVPINTDLVKKGWVPKFVTAYRTNVYVVLISNNSPNQATILNYDTENWQDQPHQLTNQIAKIISVAAFSNKQLFLLNGEGRVVTFTHDASGSATLPTEIRLQRPVWSPLPESNMSFSLATPVATPVSHSLQSNELSDLSSLVVGPAPASAGNSTEATSPHLYAIDNQKHRILDLNFMPGQLVNFPQATPTLSAVSPTPSSTPSTGVGVVNPPSLLLEQQFASATTLVSMRGATLTPDGKNLSVLTNEGRTLTTISSLEKVPSSCPLPSSPA